MKKQPSLGLFEGIATAVGLVVTASGMLTVSQGFSSGGYVFVLSLFIAFFIILCQNSSFSELSSILPTSGAIYDYVSAGMGRFWGITATLSGYIIVNMFAASAESASAGLFSQISFPALKIISPENSWLISWVIIIICMIINTIGIEMFGKAEVILSFTKWTILVVFGLIGILLPAKTSISGFFGESTIGSNLENILSMVGLAMFLVIGAEYVTPLAPEMKNPSKNIPKSLYFGLFLVMIALLLFGSGIVRQVVNIEIDHQKGIKLLESPEAFPAFGEAILGTLGRWVLGIGIFVSTTATINTIIASIPRILMGMAQDGMLPKIFAKLHPKYRTPIVGILFTGFIPMLGSYLMQGDINKIFTLILAAICAWIFTYLLINISVVLLRNRRPDLHRPYKIPFYPLPQLIASIGMLIALWNIAPPFLDRFLIYKLGLTMIAVCAVYAFIWTKYIKKVNLWKPIEPEEILKKRVNKNMNLANTDLLKKTTLIDGQWIDAVAKFEVKNPANAEILAHLPDLGEIETKTAIIAAHNAFQTWKSKSASFRANLLKKWFQLMVENEVDLGKILSAEQGKPLNEAIGEIKYGASYIEWFAEEARRTYGDIIPGHDEDKRIMVINQPIGVVGIITPWNFPNAMIARKVAPALAAGCTVVIKPSELTPLSALAMGELAQQAGIPAGVINIITTTNARAVGGELTSNKLVRKISFTGSTAVGKLLIKQAADQVKKVTMELGGNAPFIVFDDANIDDAVKGAMISKYRNAGQTCVCANRIYVQEKVYDEFIEKFKKAVAALKVGNGNEKGVEIGPLIDERAVAKVKKLLEDAQNKGAKIEIGGHIHELGGTFFEPTIVSNCSTEMDFSAEEIFGPVAPIFKFSTEQEVIMMANDTDFGLASYFYGQNINRIYRVAEALEYGMVGVNTGLISTAVAPFGGVKESGYGREGSKYGISDYMEMKYICIGGVG